VLVHTISGASLSSTSSPSIKSSRGEELARPVGSRLCSLLGDGGYFLNFQVKNGHVLYVEGEFAGQSDSRALKSIVERQTAYAHSGYHR